MKNRMHILGVVIVMSAAATAWGQGMIVPVRPDIRVSGAWAVKHHHVDITVRDQVASVAVNQEFLNTGGGMIEVEYLFPVPADTAITSLTLVVNNQEYKANLLKADEARRIYENIVRSKRDPALLEYVGYNLYKTSAFPLMPGTPAKIIVTYNNVCRKEAGTVEVFCPLSLGKFSSRPIESVRVRVDAKADADVGPVYSPSHDLKVERKGPRHVVAIYEAANIVPTVDFQVYYKAADEKIGASLLTWQGSPGQDGYFMLLASPNPRKAGATAIPKDVVAVFDHSGSMSGPKLDQAKRALTHVLKNLNAEDRFNVVAFNDSVDAFFPALVAASAANVEKALDMVDRTEATGGTNIDEAMTTAMKCNTPGPRPAYVIFLTDGAPTVGKTEEKDILADAKAANAAGARVFTFGVGYEPNVRLLDKLAADHNGRGDYVKPTEAIETKVATLYDKIRNPVMTGLSVEMPGVRLTDMYPRKLSDLFDGDQLVVVGRYDAKDAAARPAAPDGLRQATLIVRGTYLGAARAFEYNVALAGEARDLRYAFVEKIWAVRRVGFLMDQIQLNGKTQEVVDELIRLSTTYGIMTPYTSFLADETTVLHKPAVVRREAEVRTSALAPGAGAPGGGRADDEKAQMASAMRTKLADAARTEPTAPVVQAKGAAPGEWARDAVAIYGNTGKKKYEAGDQEYIGGIRQVGNQALYQRGRLFVAANASHLDPEKDAARIQTIARYTPEYFELVKRNNAEENQVLATQRDGEELLITLRGQAYRIR